MREDADRALYRARMEQKVGHEVARPAQELRVVRSDRLVEGELARVVLHDRRDGPHEHALALRGERARCREQPQAAVRSADVAQREAGVDAVVGEEPWYIAGCLSLPSVLETLSLSSDSKKSSLINTDQVASIRIPWCDADRQRAVGEAVRAHARVLKRLHSIEATQREALAAAIARAAQTEESS